MNPTETASNSFEQGYACSQSVLLAFAQQFGLSPQLAARVAAPFGGGMARQGMTCGAVTGALMVLGLCYGSPAPDEKVAKEELYRRVQHFMQVFAHRQGALECKALLNCDISTPEGRAYALDQGLFKTRCPALVTEAVSILQEMVPTVLPG